MYMYNRQRGLGRPLGFEECRLYTYCKRVGARMEPCCTPACISWWCGQFALNYNSEFSVGNEWANKFDEAGRKMQFGSLYSKPGCHVVSKAFSISKKTAALEILLLKFRVTWSTRLIHWSVVLSRARKPNWVTFSKFFSSTCLCTILKITFSVSHLNNIWEFGSYLPENTKSFRR
jgi:hypothetical protein